MDGDIDGVVAAEGWAAEQVGRKLLPRCRQRRKQGAVRLGRQRFGYRSLPQERGSLLEGSAGRSGLAAVAATAVPTARFNVIRVAPNASTRRRSIKWFFLVFIAS